MTRSTSSYPYQPALDGVRALSVAAVLAFHGGLRLLSGGFLGVDAFFVLSGFLITSLLLAELAGTGRIRLLGFWARRARRLLPALLAVVVVVVTSARWLVPGAELATLRGDALASLAYVANWRMIWRGNDYFALAATPSALQHTWSLGIEEQFYLCWPLLVIAIVAAPTVHSAAVAAPSNRRVAAWVLMASLAGAAASLAVGAALFNPQRSARVYFGTDARAQALLIGAAMAALLALAHRFPRQRLMRAARIAAAGAAVVVVGWLWSHANGSDSWLYRGGLTAGAMAVAVLIAHVVLDPHAPLARLLALTPLVWLGRISYGVYLWHWPLFQALTADRTGLHGLALLGLRCAATVAAAAASYTLVERPIRTGRWPWPWPRRLSMRVTPALAGMAATALVCATGIYAVVATVPASMPAGEPVIAVPSAVAGRAGELAAGPPPMRRPGRRPGADPRIVFLGDSVSWTLGTYLPPHPGLQVTVRAIQGCGIARLPDVIQLGEPHTNYPACPTWDARWRRAISSDDPDVAVILLDRWELMARHLDGAYRHVGDPVYDAYLTRELELAVSIAGSRGARVVLLTAPYTHRAERPDGSLYDEDRPERVDAWNRLLWAAQVRDPRHRTVIDLNARVCPDGRFTWSIDGIRVRSDGLHFTPEGVQQRIAPWLLPQLAALASR